MRQQQQQQQIIRTPLIRCLRTSSVIKNKVKNNKSNRVLLCRPTVGSVSVVGLLRTQENQHKQANVPLNLVRNKFYSMVVSHIREN